MRKPIQLDAQQQNGNRWKDYLWRLLIGLISAALIGLVTITNSTGNRLSIIETKVEERTKNELEIKDTLKEMRKTQIEILRAVASIEGKLPKTN